MARNIKLKPNQPPRRYVSVDVTGTIDTLAFGHMWNSTFGWKNLLWELDLDKADPQRRIDKAHPKLPVRWLKESLLKKSFADTCVLPQGADGRGLDPLWAGSDADANLTEMTAADGFMQTFILSPSADKSSSSLNDSGNGVTADIMYISSHGSSGGEMMGEQNRAGNIFAPAAVASKGKQFAGIGWLLLSNCSTLNPASHEFWLKLMTGATPLRGIVGFQNSCPTAKGSVPIFKTFIDELAGKNGSKKPRTFVDAWAHAVRSHVSDKIWVVLCHEKAAGDTITQWNADKLQSIPSGSKIFMFDHRNPPGKGLEVVPNTDPFRVHWEAKNGDVTPANRTDPDMQLDVGDKALLKVEPPPPNSSATFKKGDQIALTLIYIRPDYNHQAIDINRMFDVRLHRDITAPTTANRNPQSPGNDDTWEMTVTVETSSVSLILELKDRMGMKSNMPLWIRAKITTGGKTITHDFRQFGAIILK